MITSIRMHHWRSHKDSELSFERGTNVIVGPMGSGKSLPYGELVLVKKNGAWIKEPIGKLVEESLNASKTIQTLGEDGCISFENPLSRSIQTLNPATLKIEEKEIAAFIKHNAPPKLLKIRTRQGKQITITKDHSMLVLSEGEVCPVRGSDLKIGTFIPCPTRMTLNSTENELCSQEILPEFRSTTSIMTGLALIQNGFSTRRASETVGVTNWTLKNWRRRKMEHIPGLLIAKNLSHAISEKIPLSNALARICGAYVSEGMCKFDPQTGDYVIKITNNDQAFLDQIKKDWKNVFPHAPIGQTQNDLVINGKIVSALFHRLFGANAGTKKIPEFVSRFDDEQLSNFLKMYFEGDGYVSASKVEVSCSSKSRLLLDSLQTSISRWGIISRIRPVKRPQGTYYELFILPKHIPIFAQRVSFLSERKQTQLLALVKALSERKRWNGVDIVPNIEKTLRNLIREYSLGKRENPAMRKLAHQIQTYCTKEKLGRDKLTQILHKIVSQYQTKTSAFTTLEKILQADIFFDEIVELHEIPTPSEYVYDLSVNGTENFVAGLGNILTHNSSVMDCICFGLFGTFPSLQSRRVSLEETIMQKPSVEDTAKIQLCFQHNGHAYTVERTVFKTGKTNQAKLLCDESLVAGPKPTEVTKEIEKILQIDYDLFARAVYSEQNQIDYFLRLTPKERKEKFDELLQIHKYEHARQNAVQLTNRFRKNVADKQRFVLEQKQRFSTERIQELQTKITQKQTEHEKLKQEFGHVTEQFKSAQEKQSSLETQERQYRELSDQIIRLSTQTQSMQKEIEAIQTTVISRPKNELESDIKPLETTQTDQATREKMLSEELKGLQNRLLAFTENIGTYKAMQKHETDALTKIFSIDGKCPTCKKPMAEHDKEQLQKETEQLQIEITAKIHLEQQKQEETKSVQTELEKRKTEIQTSQKKNAEQLFTLKKQVADHQQLTQLETKKQECETALLAAKEKQSKNTFDEKQLKTQREQTSELKAKNYSLQKEIQSNQELVHEMQRQLEELHRLQTQIEQIEAETRHQEHLVEKLQIFTNCLSATQTQLREHLIDAINQAMNDIWKRVYPYKDFETCRMIIQEGSYELMVKTQNGEWMRVEGMLSGGERSAAAICIRLAFALVLTQNLGWIILDEPTHNLDQAGVRELSGMLRGHLPDLVEQVFVITHDKEMEKAATATLHRIDRNKDADGVSTPSKIEIIRIEE